METPRPSCFARLSAATCRWITHFLIAPADRIPSNLSNLLNLFNPFNSFNPTNSVLLSYRSSAGREELSLCPFSCFHPFFSFGFVSDFGFRISDFWLGRAGGVAPPRPTPRALATLLPLAFLLLDCSPSWATPPPNDQCSGATVISGTNYSTTQFTTDATSDNDPSLDCAFAVGSGVWYQYTPATNGVMIVDTFGSTFDTALGIFTGTCGSLTQVACNDDANGGTTDSRTAVLAAAGTTYYILAGGFQGANGKLVLHLVFTTNTVANDLCGGALVISGSNYTNTQSTLNATLTGDPVPFCAGGYGNGVWYQYTPSGFGSIVVDTFGSDFDTLLGVYSGTCGSLTEVGCNNDATTNLSTSQLTVPVNAGTTYYILAEGNAGDVGNLVLHLAFTAGPPPFDQCSGAVIVSTPNYTNTVSTVQATSTNDPVTSCGPLGKGVWYQYTPGTAGALVVDTFGSSFDTVLAVYTGTCGSLAFVACNDNSDSNPASRVSIPVSSGTTYYVLAGGLNGQTGNLVFHLAFSASALANDQCGGAIAISGSSYTNTQSTASATSTGDPVPSCATNFADGVWYKYTAPAPGGILVDTLGSGFDTALAVYTGACGALTLLACNDDFGAGGTSRVTNSVSAGTTYFILAGGSDGAFGNLNLHLTFVEGAPVNDQCSGALVVSNANYTNTQSTLHATSTNDPVPSCAALSNGVWYQYTPAQSGVLEADTLGSSFDTVLAVYSGACGSLTQLGCSDNVGSNTTSRVSVLVSGGTTYHVLAGGLNGQTGNLVFHLSFGSSTLPNDQCSGAIVISAASYTNTQSTAIATSTGDPAPSCAPTAGSAVWYQYTPPTNGFITVDTFGSDFDTVLAVYTNACGSLNEVACNNNFDGTNASQVMVPVAWATTYRILAGGAGAQPGNLVFHLLFQQPPSILTQPVSQAVPIGGSATFSVTAIGTAPLSYAWRRNGQAISGATASAYTTNNVQLSGSGSQFTCVVSNLFGVTTSQVAVLSVVLTNTFQNTNLITINDNTNATPYPSSINVAGQLGVVGKVKVILQGLTHTFPHDVGVLLVGPQGQTVVLMADAGGGQPVNDLTLTFDDNATNGLTELGPLTTGTFRPGDLGTADSFPSPAPAGPYGAGLFAFRGANPNGTWSLYVLDDEAADSGKIARGWILTLANEQPLQITQQPQSQSVFPGSTVTFSVAAVGAVPISYTWQKNGTNLSNGGQISGATNSTLTLANVQSSDAANYSVALSCASGTATSSSAALTLLASNRPWIVPGSVKRLANGQFQFTLVGAPGSNYEILESTDFRNWKLLKTVSITNATADVLDTSTNLLRRFYRAQLAP